MNSHVEKKEFEYADVHDYECKFKRKVGILPCPGVTVDVLEPVLEHCHDDDPDRHAKGLKAKKKGNRYVTL